VRSRLYSKVEHGSHLGQPDNDSNPGTPMYVCQEHLQCDIVPGRWVQGSCNVALNNSEHIVGSYDLAYADARWGPKEERVALRMMDLAMPVSRQSGQFKMCSPRSDLRLPLIHGVA
jgi:hypothetical protein